MAYYLTPAERRARAQALIEQRKNVVAYNKYLKQQKDYERQIAQAKLDEENRQKQIESQDFFTRAVSTVGDISANIITGALKGLEGIYDLGVGITGAIGGIFSKEFQDTMQKHIATDWVGTYIGDPLQELTKYSYTKNGGIIESVASGIGQMLPAVVVSIATAGAGAPAAVAELASLATLGASAAGNSTEEAYNDGASYYAGLGYGLASGAVEMATEKMFGGFGKLTGAGFLDNVTRSIAKQGFARVAKEAVEEGLEEVVSELANPALKAIYKGSEAFEEYKDPDYWKGVGQAGLVGGLTSMAYGQTVGRVMHTSGKYADISEARSEYETLRQKARNLEENGRIDATTKNGKTNRQNLYESQMENMRLIENTIKKVDESKRAKFIKRAGLEGMFNPDGSINSAYAQREGLWGLVEQSTTEGDGKPTRPLASQPERYRTAFSDEGAMQEALDRGGATAFTGEMTDEQSRDFADFKKVFGKLANKSEGYLKFIVSNESNQSNAYIDPQTGTVVIGVDQFGKGTSGVELAKAVITLDMWQKSAIHEVEHSTEGTKGQAKLAQHLYSDNAVFTEAKNAFIDRGYLEQRVGKDKQKAVEYFDGLFVKVDETIKSKPKNTSMEEWLSSHLTAEEVQDYRTAQSERAAIAAENVLGNEAFIKKLLRKDTNIAQKILNRIMDMKEAFTSLKSKAARSAYTYLQKAEKLYLKAIEEVGAKFQKRRIIGIKRLEEGEEIDAAPQIVYNEGHSRKDSLINRTFPTYKEGKGTQANELATRWAHRADIQAGDLTAISFNDSWYLIEKFDDSEWSYQIIDKLTEKEYLTYKEEWNNGNRQEQSIQKGVSRFTSLDRQRNSSFRGESNNDVARSQQRGENQEVRGLGEEQSQRRETQSNRGGDSESRRSSKQGLKYSLPEEAQGYIHHDSAFYESEKGKKIASTMSMETCKQMIERTYYLINPNQYEESPIYKNAEHWLSIVGADEVALYVDNEYILQEKYLNKIPAVLDGEVYVAQIIEAYQDKALNGGNNKKTAKRLNVAEGVESNDSRFYAPQRVEEAKKLYEVANQKVTNANRSEVTEARAKILIFAHNRGAAAELGITQSELNKKLRSWSNYSANAREISQRINNGVAFANMWSGIENSSYLYNATIAEEDFAPLVGRIEGRSSEYERRYIANTMLALDTHIDYTGINFVFGENFTEKGVRGKYSDKDRTIRVRGGIGQQTVAHEIGHAIDHQWARDVWHWVDKTNTGTNNGLSEGLNLNLITIPEVRQWVENYFAFIDNISDSGNIHSEYLQSKNEVFARFVAQFVDWTVQLATGRSSLYAFSDFNDKFTASQFVEFAKILQEKAKLDTKFRKAEDVEPSRKGIKFSRKEKDNVYHFINKLYRIEISWNEADDTYHLYCENSKGYLEYEGTLTEEQIESRFGEEFGLDLEIKAIEKRGQVATIDRSWIEYYADEIKPSEKYDDDYLSEAKKQFGTTNNILLAGYINTDGSMLDFSGGYESRFIDHNDIDVIFDDEGGADAMYAYMRMGNIRLMPEAPSLEFNSKVEPTSQQYSTIKRAIDVLIEKHGKFFIEFSNNEGQSISNRRYERGVATSQILDDIAYFYKNGKLPYQSDLSRFRYSLKPVKPVEPSSGEWHTTIDTDKALARFPNLWNVKAEESETRNPTQIKGTVSTYRKIYEILKREGFNGRILDASSGLGYGTQAGISEYGFNVEDIEPYPDSKYKPKYTDYSSLDKKYDVVISNAVLNVLPQDQRDALVVKMGEFLDVGGRLFVNVRGDDVNNLSSNPSNVRIGDMEWYVAPTGSYQKGFTRGELVAYLKDALGKNFKVEATTLFGKSSAIVTKIADDRIRHSLKDSEGKKLSESQQKFFKDSKVRDSEGDLLVMYHGTNSRFFTFNMSKRGSNGAMYGVGYYFISDKDYAKSYGKNIIKAYLNIKKPVSINTMTISQNEWGEYLQYAKEHLDEYIAPTEWQGNTLFVDSELRQYSGYISDVDAISLFINGISGGNQTVTEAYLQMLTDSIGYDGVFLNDSLAVAFNPNQIKLTDNLNPTTNEDIRFSRKIADEPKRTYYHLSDGQIKKMLANSTRYKVYTKADAEGIINNVLQNYMSFGEKYGDMSGKTKAQVIDMLWKGLNSAKPGYQMSVALNIADYIIQNSVLESLYGDMENYDVQQALDVIGALKPYLHNINLDSLKGEIRHKYDRDNSAYLLWGKRKGEKGYGADQIAQELQERGIFIDAINEADIFFEIDTQYRNAIKALKKRAKEMLSESLPKEQQKALRQEIAREILRGFDYTGKSSQLAGVVDKYRKQIATLYDKLRDSKRHNQATNRLLDKVQKIKNWKTGAFVNSSKFRPKLFKGSIERLAMIKNRGNLNQSGTRRILAGLAAWYTKDNPLLGYVDAENAGQYNEEIASILQAVAQNQKPLTDEQIDLISFLQEKSGISDYKGLVEWYTKENLKKGYSADVKKLLRELASETTFTTEELIALEKVVGYFGNLIENHNKVIRNGKYVDAKPIAERYIDTLERNKGVKVGWFGKFFDKVANNGKASYLQTFADPMTVARYMDKYESGFYTEMLEELRNGAIRADVLERNIRLPLEKFLSKHKKYGKGVSKRTVTYRGVELPALDALLLYMTLNREQALAGLAESGFAFNDGKETIRVDGFAKGIEGLTLDELRDRAKTEQDELFKQFTEEDKEFILIAEKIFNEDCKEMKRATDMLRLGYSNVFEGYYVPIRRANGAITIDTSTFFEEMNRVSNASFNKDTVQGAKGELFIEGLDEVLDRHIHGVSLYAALAPVIDQYDILYNLNMVEDANKPKTVRTESENTWAKGNDYFKKLISDIQGISPTRGGGSKLFGFLRGSYAKYQLGLNPKVWLTQLSSIFASSSILDYSSIIKGFGIKAPDVDDYCSLAAVRNNDNSAAMAQSVLDKVDKLGSALMKPIGKVDRFVIKRLFGACQVQVQKENGLKVGTRENKVKAGELLEKVILETQQNSMATERSAAMRSGSELMKSLTMFTADSMKVFGRVVDSFGEVSVLKHKIKETADPKVKESLQAQLKAANKKARKSVTALAATAIFMALVAQAFRWLYDKDDDDESALETMTVDAIGNLMGGLPLIKDIYAKLTEGYELNNYAYSAINDLFDAFASVVNFSEGKPAKKVKDIAYAVGQFFGIPTRNVYNIFYGLTKKFSPTTAYEIDNVFYNKNYASDLQKAIDNDDEDMIATITGLMLDEKVGAIENATAKRELNSLVAAGYKVLPRSIGNSITYNGEEIALTSRQREQFKSVYSEANNALASLVEGKAYRSATEEVKAKAIAFIWDIYYNLAIEDLLGVDLETKNTLFAKAIDISSLAIIVATARGLEADTDKKGKVISGSKKAKVQGYINSLGLKAAQKYMIMGYLGYTNKNGKSQVRSYIQRLRLSKSEKEKLYEYSGYAA